jgi:hypothetical protein
VRRPADYALSELLKPFGRESAHLKARMTRYDRRMFAIRTIREKFIWSSDGCHEFYDLRADPGETRNLLTDPACEARIAPLRAAAEAHAPLFQSCATKYAEVP